MIVVTDTSVILNLCLLEQESLLPELFGEICAPIMVRAEFERLSKFDSRFLGLIFPSFIEIVGIKNIPPDLQKNHKIHQGEVEAISLALERQANALLIDERAGRLVASDLGLRCMGILGILLQAKSQDCIPSISPLIDRLGSEGGFWMSRELRDKVLSLAGEI